jgi:hypothetical protein
MHAWRFWSRGKEIHHGSKAGQPAVKDHGREQRMGGCARRATSSVTHGSDPGAHDTGRYVYVDNFR